MTEIVDRIKAEHRRYIVDQKIRTTIQKWKAHESLTMQEKSIIESTQGMMPTEEVTLIRPLLVLDDLASTHFLASHHLTNLALRQRHICANPRVGLNIIVCNHCVVVVGCRAH